MLKNVNIIARDLPDAWYQCVNKILDEGYIYTITKGSYEGQKRWEFDYITIQITHPNSRPLIPDLPPGMAIPPPVESMEAIEKYLPYLMTNEIKENEIYTYGERLVGASKSNIVERFGSVVESYFFNKKVDSNERVFNAAEKLKGKSLSSVNQIQTVIDMFKNTGEGTNQATMEIGQPSDCGIIDPPCCRLIDCRLRYGKLHFMVYFRSWDLWGGMPANLAAIQLLKEYMAAEIGCEDGEIIASSKGLHLYDFSWDLAKLRTYRK